jgi:hypothetical protein
VLVRAVSGARSLEIPGGIRLELDLQVAAGQTRDLVLEISDQPLVDAAGH